MVSTTGEFVGGQHRVHEVIRLSEKVDGSGRKQTWSGTAPKSRLHGQGVWAQVETDVVPRTILLQMVTKSVFLVADVPDIDRQGRASEGRCTTRNNVDVYKLWR